MSAAAVLQWWITGRELKRKSVVTKKITQVRVSEAKQSDAQKKHKDSSYTGPGEVRIFRYPKGAKLVICTKGFSLSVYEPGAVLKSAMSCGRRVHADLWLEQERAVLILHEMHSRLEKPLLLGQIDENALAREIAHEFGCPEVQMAISHGTRLETRINNILSVILEPRHYLKILALYATMVLFVLGIIGLLVLGVINPANIP